MDHGERWWSRNAGGRELRGGLYGGVGWEGVAEDGRGIGLQER